MRVRPVFAGKPALTAPATIHQIALQDGPLAWTAEPGGLLVHDFDPGEPPRTHYLPVAAAQGGASWLGRVSSGGGGKTWSA